MDLLEMNLNKILGKEAPLAVRMRPRNLNEFIGQEHILGEGKVLRKAIEADNLKSVLFYGPTGCGKTALAQLISNITSSHFEQINAVMAGIVDIKKAVVDAETRRTISGVRTVVFIDEIHRFNKAQQDALLPFVESGLIILIGATTENPMMAVNNALLSRALVFELKPLTNNEMKEILNRAIIDKERGLGNFDIKIDNNAIEHIVRYSSGDARALLNTLEMAVFTTKPDKKNVRHITLEVVQDVTQKRILEYDDGQTHYDVISAFIKSMRGSDPQATVYWLARMIYSGEDPLFIVRRIIICASEDVGLADSNALIVAVSALEALRHVGMPEGRIILAHAAIYIALAPKSNSAYTAIAKALDNVEKSPKLKVPIHLRDKHYSTNFLNEKEVEYKYPHDYPGGKVKQEYLPYEIKDELFYLKSKNDKK